MVEQDKEPPAVRIEFSSTDFTKAEVHEDNFMIDDDDVPELKIDEEP